VGILTDILVAAPSEARSILADLRHASNWPCEQFKGLTPIELGDLCSALGIEGGCQAFRLLAADDHAKAQVYQFPEDFPKLLAVCDDAQLVGVAAKWAAGEELSFEGVDPADMDVPLRRMRELSKYALVANKPLLLWLAV